ncbi:hypothetical protein [Pseudacidovorax sp. RU35E]|uniref:hypothetical protein n=1 Tax=Pseudacidovorax sp. RU35E TaxID=1907403 RepID=UPI00095599B6|nr:hypothetical protein [Pseudacidovorax sp. RU35E]SIP93955.1 hypothetical protein SAMN05880557_101209 [Pseudacidovorax sp. RU35E]
MPVIKLFTAQAVTVDTAEALAQELELLCTGPLRAQPSAIQIVLMQAVSPRGAAVLLEAHYRDQPYRDGQALAAFMDGAEQAVRRHLGTVPRIRCFAIDQATLHARH